MSASSLSYLCEKYEVGKEADENISSLLKRGQGGFLTIYWDPFCVGDSTNGKVIDFSIFYSFLCCWGDISEYCR